MNRQEAGRRIAEGLFWQGISMQQSRRNEEAAATKWWEHQQVAQEFKIPVIYKPLNGSAIKIIPFVEAPRDTNNK